MLIRLHVYEDGDTELKRVEKVAAFDTDLHYDESDTNALREELKSYGCWNENHIETAINDVLTSNAGEEIII